MIINYLTLIAGKIFGGMCAVFGLLIVSLPVGVISSKFSELLEKTKKEEQFIKVEKELIDLRKAVSLFNEKFNSRSIKHKTTISLDKRREDSCFTEI